jgi:hypothetical protein
LLQASSSGLHYKRTHEYGKAKAAVIEVVACLQIKQASAVDGRPSTFGTLCKTDYRGITWALCFLLDHMGSSFTVLLRSIQHRGAGRRVNDQQWHKRMVSHCFGSFMMPYNHGWHPYSLRLLVPSALAESKQARVHQANLHGLLVTKI